MSGETDARNAVPAQDFYGQDQSPTGEVPRLDGRTPWGRGSLFLDEEPVLDGKSRLTGSCRCQEREINQ